MHTRRSVKAGKTKKQKTETNKTSARKTKPKTQRQKSTSREANHVRPFMLAQTMCSVGGENNCTVGRHQKPARWSNGDETKESETENRKRPTRKGKKARDRNSKQRERFATRQEMCRTHA